MKLNILILIINTKILNSLDHKFEAHNSEKKTIDWDF